MKNLTIGVLMLVGANTFAQLQVLQGSITEDLTLTNNNTYLMRGYVYVKNGATLTIEPGTVILGEKATKGSLIITKNGKINAQGTVNQPIVFTSNQAPGLRNAGDWGGIVILGNAPTNCLDFCIAEGGINNSEGDGIYGGNNPEDNSGVLSYVRIEFAGIAFNPDSEINGLTLCGVGNGTQIDHIQVSFCGDDSFEWFGGTVNASYLVSYNALDDDFDTDLGFRGNVQFGIGIRNRTIADISQSNGYESDNSKYGDAWQPFTSPTFSNMTLIGPISNPANPSGINPNYYAGLHLRRNARVGFFNSVFVGYPFGLVVDGESCESAIINGETVFSNNVIAGCVQALRLLTYNGPNTLNIGQWWSQNNQTETTVAPLQLTSPFTNSNPNVKPLSGSPLLSGALFSNTRLQNPFFTSVNFRGALGQDDWTQGWTNWDPQNWVVSVNELHTQSLTFSVFPNPASEFFTINTGDMLVEKIEIIDLKGKVVQSNLINQSNPQIKINNNIKTGVYFVKVYTNGSSVVERLVVR